MKTDVLQRLVDASNTLLECLAKVRFTNWPSGFDPDVRADEIDQALQEGDAAIRHAKRFIKKETSDKEQLKRQVLARLTPEEREALGFGG